MILSISLAVFLLASLGLNLYLRDQRFQLQVRLDEALRQSEEQKRVFREAKDGAQDSFKALAGEALDKNMEIFLKLATERLDKKTVEAKSSLEEKTLQFTQAVSPMKDLLTKLENDFHRIEKERGEQFGRISEHLKTVSDASDKLRLETSSLSSALRRPEVRGSWGELQLKRVVELAGMSSYCDFEEQVAVQTQDGLQKPDMIVHLPNKRMIVVDSKAVLDAFLDAVEAKTDEEKRVALERHARNLRGRVKELAKKSYWDQFENSPDFVVLFVPNEALLASAVEVDRAVIEDALSDKIIIATPTTLVALLKAIAYGWQQDRLAENAQNVLRSAKEFYERLLPWMKKLSDVGVKLDGAVKSFNESIGSLESRVLPSARRMKELSMIESDEIAAPEQVDRMSKTIANRDELPAIEPNAD